jgi:hypothetical protein
MFVAEFSRELLQPHMHIQLVLNSEWSLPIALCELFKLRNTPSYKYNYSSLQRAEIIFDELLETYKTMHMSYRLRIR